ncbi:sugar kinase [Blastococcus sp. PRF04-17]|uniref:sugar kinase n=1 Tax=Blastococcus sp. PRF04-17 TaxID=2933797 RepID=UPI001FF6ECC3|nr:sugar kinase [Blastococcus sp. PRF04-17]UOY00125.1 sugar kinase [Blastococcus sp. PRF04-17]
MSAPAVGGVVTLGETMALLWPPEVGPLRHAPALRLGVAGAESNVAVGVVRLGVPAAWVGRVGDDEFGRMVTMTLRGQGVHTTAVVDAEARTGLMVKERRTARVTRVLYYRAGSAGSRLSPADLDPAVIGAAGVLHVTGITPALSPDARAAVFAAVEEAVGRGVPVSVDLNYRSALWSPADAGPVLRDLVRRADVVMATEDEARLVVDGADARTLIGALGALGAADVLLKQGAEGSVSAVDGALYRVPARPVAVVDSVGAGDAFGAGYLSGLCRGLPADERLALATSAGAFAVTVPGDWEGLPTLADLALLDEGDTVLR